MKTSFIAALALLVCVAFAKAANAQASEDKFKIYFEQRSAVVTPAAKDTAAAVVKHIVADNAGAIAIVGHSDTRENSQPLSLKRAKAVEAQMRKDGLPATVTIAVSGVGASELAIPTGPGVYEPLNRFVGVQYL